MGFSVPIPWADPEYLREIWGLFAVGTFTIALRFAVRIRTVGFRGFQGDDAFMVLVQLGYLADAICVTYTYLYGSNLDWSQAELIAMSASDRAKVELASRLELLAWFTYTILIWGLKACMLFFFRRLTIGLEQHNLVRWIAVAVAVSWLACILTYLCSCVPIQKNWQLIPDPGPSCTVRLQNLYVGTVLNVLTDAAIMYVPMPLLWRLRVSWRRKLALFAMLSSGIFVITASIIRISFTLQHKTILNLNRWSVRETIAAIIAVNVPIIRPFFSKAFWRLGPFSTDDGSSFHHKSSRTADGNPSGLFSSQRHKTADIKMYSQSARTQKGGTITSVRDRDADSDSDNIVQRDGTSQDSIIQRPASLSMRNRPDVHFEEEFTPPWDARGITVETTYDVRPEARNERVLQYPGRDGIYRPAHGSSAGHQVSITGA